MRSLAGEGAGRRPTGGLAVNTKGRKSYILYIYIYSGTSEKRRYRMHTIVTAKKEIVA